ncbi:DUF3077 domain-containing protein [Pseudomonas lini]
MTDPTTKSTPFARCDHVDHHLFAVQPGIPLLDALEHASVYLSCAEALAHQAPHRHPPGTQRFVALGQPADARHRTLAGASFGRRFTRRSGGR